MQQSLNICRAIIPIAGLGTRLLPVSRVIPKELFPIAGKPVIQHLVEECHRAGIREIIFIISKSNRPLIEKYFDTTHAQYMNAVKNPAVKKSISDLKKLMQSMKFRYILQKRPCGDGDAILKARRFIKKGEKFFVSMGDLLVESRRPYIKEMADAAAKYHGYVLAVDEVHPHHVNRYGIIDPAKRLGGRVWEMRGMVEKPAPGNAPSNIALIGKYILDEKIFDTLKKVKPDTKGEVKLAYALSDVLAKKSAKLLAYQITGRHFDCGDWDGLRITSSEFRPVIH